MSENEEDAWSVLRWTGPDDPAARRLRTVVLDEAGASGAFMLLELIRLFLSGGVRVVLLSTERSPSHYLALLRKTGADITAPSRLLHFIDCVSEEEGWRSLAVATDVDLDRSGCVAGCATVLAASGESFVAQVVKELRAASQGPTKAVFVVDNLSTCRHRAGVRGMHAICGALRPIAEGTVLLAHSDTENLEDVAALTHGADRVVCIEPLATGAARDFDGKCSVSFAPEQVLTYLYAVRRFRVRFRQR